MPSKLDIFFMSSSIPKINNITFLSNLVYAPESDIDLSGKSTFGNAIFAKSISKTGKAAMDTTYSTHTPTSSTTYSIEAPIIQNPQSELKPEPMIEQ